MFASEKVMLDYLGQLLQEEPEQEKQETLATAESQPVESNRSEKQVLRSVESTAEPQSKDNLRPIISRKTNPLDFVRSMSQSRTINPSVPAPEPKPKVETVSNLKPFAEPEIAEPSAEARSVEKLLQQVSAKQQEEKIAKEQQKTVDLVRSVTQSPTQVIEKVEQTPEPVAVEVEAESFPEEPFQALFFDVAGLVLAVPLQDLGGIHNLTEVNSLFGKPDWFKGVMINREKKLNVVDSARWVMPEKFNKNMEESLNYQYVIMLGESEWGLAAEKLVETESINPEQVKWRKNPGKRPWLMGTIKEKMCALLHVSDLIAMLEQGVNARQE